MSLSDWPPGRKTHGKGIIGTESMAEFHITIFIAGEETAQARRSVETLGRILDEQLPGRYELEVVDVIAHPARAEKERILATPTIVRQLPPPARRIIGEIADPQRLLVGLNIDPTASPEANGERHDR